ncbi:MAG: hypothetical protein M0Q26_08860 [Chitinophagaceae bacterium]|nr:hypothetical protein [Chitinophagaceae bacterium]MDP1764561.1 hypothetical protein [Sediminibacterium sp.]MDP1810778.1 hypothetical protein [Sediminibacterium sp.]MDP3667472.1 hypothetical protein [Sediminibacterium sp.]
MASFRSFIGSELMSIKQNISAIRNMIPNNIKLKPSERRSMFKLNTKRHEFVEKAVQFMRKNPNTVPNFVDVTVCNNYVHLYGQYTELIDELEQVKTKLEDAKLVIGNEILKQTRAYFQNSKNASESGNEVLAKIYKELKPHYAVGRNTTKTGNNL